LNKKEVASRHESGMVSSMMGTFSKRPDVARAATVGEPTMTDPTPVNATDVVQETARSLAPVGGPSNQVTGEITNATPGESQAAPRSDAPPAVANPPADQAPPDSGATSPGTAGALAPAPAGTDQGAAPVGELQPNVAPDPNELKPNIAADPNALPPPQQTNEISNDRTNSSSATSSSSSTKSDDLVDISSSKKKKKKGLGKLNPF